MSNLSSLNSTIVLILMMANCSYSYQSGLQHSRVINEVFKPQEIEDLTNLLHFFESQICELSHKNETNIQACYKGYRELRETAHLRSTLDLNISYNKQLELYERMDPSTIDALWTHYKTIFHHNNQADTLQELTYELNGPYVQFLKELGRSNTIINDYYETLVATGGISPAMEGMVMYDLIDSKLDKVEVRLMIAIHFLTINDNTHKLSRALNGG